MRYSGVRALSGTISIGTLHNGARGDEDIDDPDRSEAGDDRVEGRGNGDNHDAVSEHDIGGHCVQNIYCIAMVYHLPRSIHTCAWSKDKAVHSGRT